MKKHPLISIIVPVYNVEAYIEECLDSLIAQDLGIENMEVIIVNDCTQDNTMQKVQKYIDQYPSLFQVLEHLTNQGLGTARNTGWKQAKGKYITFIDSDDFLDSNVFSLSIEKMENDDMLDIVLYAYEYYSESNKQYPRNPSSKLFSLNKAISQYEIPQYPELMHAFNAWNKVFRSSFLKNIPMFPKGHFEDMLFSIHGYLNAQKIYITDRTTYFYRKRENNNVSIMDNLLNKKSNYYDHLANNEELYNLSLQYPHLSYALSWVIVRTWCGFILKILNNEIDFNEKEREELFIRTKRLWSTCDADNLYSDGINKNKKRLVRYIQQTSSYAELQKLLNPNKSSNTAPQNKDLKYFLKKIIPAKYIPVLKKIKRKLLIQYPKALKTVFEDKTHTPAIPLQAKKVQQEIDELKKSSKYLHFPDNIWLFSERGDEAKDNAYVLFRFMREHYPHIPAYYIFTKEDSDTYTQIAQLGNIIDKKNDQHKIAFLKAKYLICTHVHSFIAPWHHNSIKTVYPEYFNKKYIFLQHGITKDDISEIVGKEKQNFDIFITGAKPEYDYILKNFGYTEEEVKYTGFPRFDMLHTANTKKQILLMPTWRASLCQPSWVEKRTVNDSKFITSEYYKRYQELLNSDELIALLKKNDLELIFYPHYEVQQYLKYFTSPSKQIIIADKDAYDVQTLLKESKLLITDYSSVFFDFAYMNKPVIYYQFDEKEFFSAHYKKGYFNYKTDGFGTVCNYQERVLYEMQKAINSDFELSGKYTKRVKDFFPLHDTNNCERIYDEIIKL